MPDPLRFSQPFGLIRSTFQAAATYRIFRFCGAGDSGRPAFFFLARGSLNGLPRTLPVFRRKLREPSEGARSRQMMPAINADGIDGELAASSRHQKDQEIEQLIHP